MPIQIITSLIVVAFTIYVGFLTYENRRRITCMTGMMIAMTNAMMSSTILGLQFGYYFLPDLAIPTMLAIVVGMVAGYFTGKPVSLMSGLDGLMAGIMGGMMGAMVGVMIQPAQKNMFTIFMLVIYLITMLLLVKMMREEVIDETPARKQEITNKPKTKNKSSVFTFITIGFGFVAIISVIMAGKMMMPGNTSANTDIKPEVVVENGVQTATINVNGYGYGPETLQIEAGIPTKLKLVVDPNAGCSRQIVSEDLGFSELLMSNDEKIIDVGTLQPGTYQYRCGMGMYWGTIVVQ